MRAVTRWIAMVAAAACVLTLGSSPTLRSTASGPDRVKPLVRIISPTARVPKSGPRVRLRGRAKDNRGVAAVHIQIRAHATKRWLRPDGRWARRPARLRTHLARRGARVTRWRLSTTLPRGNYRLSVVARDRAGHRSKRRRTSFTVASVTSRTPTRVVLTPTTSPQSSQAFSWRGGARSGSSRLQIQPAAGGPTRRLAATPTGTVRGDRSPRFSASASGLEPDTAYRYRVGQPGLWSNWHVFTTADPTSKRFSFLYFGDAQVGLRATWRRVVQAAARRVPDAIGSLHAGDLVNDANRAVQWRDWFSGLGDTAATSNIVAAPGNHEYRGDRLLKAWKTTFEYPRNHPTRATIGALADLARGNAPVARQYAAYFDHFTALGAETVYYTDYQGVRFVSLNATREQGFLRPPRLPRCVTAQCPSKAPGDLWIRFQAAWLDQILDRPGATWEVVTFHQPVYSASVDRDEPILRRHWVPVLESHDVDLVLMGHDHVYSRGYKNTSATGTPGLTSGPVYVVSNAGAQHYRLERNPTKNVWRKNGATQVRTGQGLSTYQSVDVTGTTLRYRSWLVEKGPKANTAVRPGSLFDEFRITRRPDGRTWVTEPGVNAPH